MKTFVVRLLYFVLPIVVLAYPLDKLISHFVATNTSYPAEYEVWNDIYNQNIKAEIAIYGSSRSWVQFDSKVFEDSLHKSTYNFGIDGHNFWLQYLRHLEYVKHNPKPTHIILSVDLFTLQKRKDLNQPTQFLPYMLWNNTIKEYVSAYEGFKKSDYFIPLVRYGGQTSVLKAAILSSYQNQKNKPFRYHGYRGMDIKWNNDFEKAKQLGKKNVVVIDTPSIRLLETFIHECKQAHIQLAMVYAPEFIEGQAFTRNRVMLMTLFNQISKRNKISFVDYSNHPLSYEKVNFYNASHLNKTGSKLFTQILTHELLKINFFIK
jgi:hypothetical protein